MKKMIDYDSLNVQSGSLDEFVESDAPGTLSWLKVEANDLDIDVPPFKEIDLSSVLPPCAATKLNKPGFPCKLRCTRCKEQLLQATAKMEIHYISNRETK